MLERRTRAKSSEGAQKQKMLGKRIRTKRQADAKERKCSKDTLRLRARKMLEGKMLERRIRTKSLENT